MNLNEYKELMLEEIRMESNVNITDVSSEFIRYVTDILISAEEFDDFTETYFEVIGKSNRRVQIDGFSFDEIDKTCILLISDFTNNDQLEKITAKDIDKAYSRLEGFVKNSINGLSLIHI